jgi:hypothetical protein
MKHTCLFCLFLPGSFNKCRYALSDIIRISEKVCKLFVQRITELKTRESFADAHKQQWITGVRRSSKA